MKETIEFHANGKLLIAGEYLVLVGAKALAMPVRFGQCMIVHETSQRVLEWDSADLNGIWFSASFEPETLMISSSGKMKIAIELKKLLTAARKLNPGFLAGSTGWKVNVSANYPLAWGLGSSSTLCYLVAAWAGVNEFELFRLISKGSGYDIACAGHTGLLYYQLVKGRQEITPAKAGNALRSNTWFSYLGNKQQTSTEVASFMENQDYSDIDLVSVSHLSEEICLTDSPEELIRLVNEHEFILSTILKREPVARRFPSFPGTVKSLGAWGGDFAMFVSEHQPETVVNHLHGLGFVNIFSFNDLELAS
jgi:mevalonate kinase